MRMENADWSAQITQGTDNNNNNKNEHCQKMFRLKVEVQLS